MFGEGFARNPWPVLSSLRDDSGGVHRVATPDGPPAWLVTRAADVHRCLLDNRLSTNVRFAKGSDYRGFAVPAPMDAFQTSDPDDLARLRRGLIAELAPRRLGEWTTRISQLIAPTINRLERVDDIDFVDRVAVPLPAVILGDLLGLPDDARDRLLAWAESTMRADAAPRARDTLASMQQITSIVIEHGRATPDRSVLARLITDGQLSGDQLTGLVFYLLFVWYEVLIDLLAGSVLALSNRPRQLDTFRCGDQLAAVDELLRYLSPQMLAGPRFPVVDVAIGGHVIPAGQTILLCLASANHDPERFDRPDELDLSRSPQSHMALGHGSHACIGAALVRPITAGVLDQLFSRWPELRVTNDENAITWRSGFRHRGPRALPIRPGRPGEAVPISGGEASERSLESQP
ncbi:cytochrome P450 [Nocardia sp. 004]|uniref:cytochrome P450 n=1 Tax=Nocardia sp. 004 TaxID=3385978 RepID=UPI0039A0597E